MARLTTARRVGLGRPPTSAAIQAGAMAAVAVMGVVAVAVTSRARSRDAHFVARREPQRRGTLAALGPRPPYEEIASARGRRSRSEQVVVAAGRQRGVEAFGDRRDEL